MKECFWYATYIALQIKNVKCHFLKKILVEMIILPLH